MMTDTLPPSRLAWSAGVSWALAAIGAVLVGVFAPSYASIGWLPIVMAAVVLFTFTLQLAIERKEGLVDRIVLSLGGAVVILAVASLVLWLLHGLQS